MKEKQLDIKNIYLMQDNEEMCIFTLNNYNGMTLKWVSMETQKSIPIALQDNKLLFSIKAHCVTTLYQLVDELDNIVGVKDDKGYFVQKIKNESATIIFSLLANGGLQLTVVQSIKTQNKLGVQLNKIKKNKTGYNLLISTPQNIFMKKVSLVMKERSKMRMVYAVQTNYFQKKRKNFYDFFIDVLQNNWTGIYWDAYVLVDDGLILKQLFKVNNTKIPIVFRLQYTHSMELRCNQEKIINAYITSNNTLSICVRKESVYDSKKYKNNERIAILLYVLFGWSSIFNKNGLIFEKFANSAQDNGYYFFKYCQEQKIKYKLYYVIQKASCDYSNLQPYKNNIIEFMSIKHLYLILTCQLIIASEAKSHGYIWRKNYGWIRQKLNQKPYVFLQHGVLGLKKIDNIFGKNGMSEAIKFVVSLQAEKQIAIQHLNYNDQNVIVAGLPRWDYLEEVKTGNTAPYIFCMPTWRNWLEEVTEEEFLASEYFKQYNKLLASQQISDYLREKNIKFIFYLHPKFAGYAHLFVNDKENITVVSTDQAKPLNTLLSSAKIVITDYSSIAYEAYYQDIPVVFFHFDRTQYLNFQESYINLAKDLIGPVAWNSEELVTIIRNIAKKNFIIDKKYQINKQNIFTFIDKRNNQRIVNELANYFKGHWRKDFILYKIKHSYIIRLIWSIYKRRRLF